MAQSENGPVRTALLFPGQGSLDIQFLALLMKKIKNPVGADMYAQICEALEFDLVDYFMATSTEPARQLSMLSVNRVSSSLNFLLSALALEEYKQESDLKDHFFAGYSVGQLSSLYANGTWSFSQTLEAILKRCEFMDKVVSKAQSFMIAVIGLRLEVLKQYCKEHTNIFISNYNSPGQYSLAALGCDTEALIKDLHGLGAKKAYVLPTSGAWHCPWLEPAGREFVQFLASFHFDNLSDNTLDNVSGHLLPCNKEELILRLGQHLYSSVQWEKCIRFLISLKCVRFIEIGYGTMLSKMMFFIDRTQKYGPYWR